MSIKFVCTCGKRLRARDEMAARRSVCPRCGAPVGIPSRTPTHEETSLGPMTPAERVREQMRRLVQDRLASDESAPAFGINRQRRVPAPDSSRPPVRLNAGASGLEDAGTGARAPVVHPQPNLNDTPISLIPNRTWRASRHYCPRCRGLMEARWYECLAYPWRSITLISKLSVILTVAICTLALALPALLTIDFQRRDRLLAFGAWFFFAALIASYIFAFLESVLTAAGTGEGPRVALGWPHPFVALSCGPTWFACFLAGPVGLAGIAFLYWIRCGDATLLDWFILTELVAVAVGYWLLCVTAVVRSGRLRDANPLAVLSMFDWLGSRVLVAAALASAFFLAHGYGILAAVKVLHDDLAAGAGFLGACCFSGLVWSTFLFRLLGVWCHLAMAQAGRATVNSAA